LPPELPQLFQTLGEVPLPPFRGRMVILASAEVVGKTFHISSDFGLKVVRVLIAFAVSDLFHQGGDRVADVKRHWLGGGRLHIFQHLAVSGVERI
jgi:hypothetical protein